jgi:hypothetical protein
MQIYISDRRCAHECYIHSVVVCDSLQARCELYVIDDGRCMFERGVLACAGDGYALLCTYVSCERLRGIPLMAVSEEAKSIRELHSDGQIFNVLAN